MRIIQLNDDTLATGQMDYYDYKRAVLCGVSAPQAYEDGMVRGGGVEALYGATMACLSDGIRELGEVVRAVSRVTRCRDTTVRAFIDAVTGPDAEDSLLELRAGHLSPHRRPAGRRAPGLLIAD